MKCKKFVKISRMNTLKNVIISHNLYSLTQNILLDFLRKLQNFWYKNFLENPNMHAAIALVR
jgi:hypothetical protein